ncbi:MAG: hypothetical protein ACOC22_00375 [bacterium]
MKENKNIKYKPIVWYKSEFIWLLISLVWQVIFWILIGQNILTEHWAYPMFLGTIYTAYFIIKGIIYAYFINPKKFWKKLWDKLKNIF